jgi:hypothetical protein
LQKSATEETLPRFFIWIAPMLKKLILEYSSPPLIPQNLPLGGSLQKHDKA